MYNRTLTNYNMTNTAIPLQKWGVGGTGTNTSHTKKISNQTINWSVLLGKCRLTPQREVGAMMQQVGTPASHLGMVVQVPAKPLPVLLPANAPMEAGDGSGTCTADPACTRRHPHSRHPHSRPSLAQVLEPANVLLHCNVINWRLFFVVCDYANMLFFTKLGALVCCIAHGMNQQMDSECLSVSVSLSLCFSN